MLLKADEIASRMELPMGAAERIVIRPQPTIAGEKLGAASVDLRLGCWFGQLRRSRMTHFDIAPTPEGVARDIRPLKRHYVPFGQKFILHPRDFVLAATLEWIRMPALLAGYVIG